MPETSQIGPKAREAGETARRSFEEGFSSGGGGSTLFEKVAQGLSSKISDEVSAGLRNGLANMELPGGAERVIERLSMGFEGVRAHTERAEAALKGYEQAHERLTAALEREAVAQARLDDLHARGAQGGQLAAGLASVEQAHRRVAQASEADAEAHERYTKVVDSGSSSLMTFAASTGVVSGAISAGITLGAELITSTVEAAVEGFHKIIETGEEVAKEIVEIGEHFEDMHRQIELSTTASGSALEELKAHSDALVASLDVSTDKLGTDIATLSTRLHMEAGPELDALTRNVEELRDRFGSLDTSAFAGALTQFGVSGDQANQSLASLVESSREFGVSLGGLINDLATAAPALSEFDLNLEQSGHLLADLSSQHINASNAVNALTRAEKGAAEQHVELKDFVKQELDVIEQYIASNDKAGAQAEAMLAFGTKNWVQATAAAKAYLETVNAGPDAYKGNVAEMQHLEAVTQSLENRWQELHNKMEVAFAPFASVALDKISEAVSKLGEFISQHQSQILDFVNRLGHDFINAIPAIQEFAEATLKFMGEVADSFAHQLGAALTMIGKFGEGLHSIPGLAKLLGPLAQALADNGQAIDRMGNSLMHANVEQYTDKWAAGIDKIRPDLQGMADDLDRATDAMKRHLDELENASSGVDGVAAAPGDIGHIAPPPSAFGGTDDDPGGAGGEPPPAEQPGGGGEGGATPVHPRSWHMTPPDNNGVGGPHVVMANWHPRVEAVDNRQYTETGGGGPKNPGERDAGGGEHHGGDPFPHPSQRGTTGRQDRSHTRRLEDLNDKIDDDTSSITDLTQAQKDAAAKLKSETALRDSYIPGTLAWNEENKKVVADNKELSRITKELNRTLRDRTRSEEDIDDENANYADSKNKGRGGKSGEGGPAEDFGKNFLSGLLSDIGLGGLLGKSPLDWGLPKIAEGIAGWALGGDSGGSSGGGGGGGQSLLQRLFNPNGAASSSSDGAEASPFIYGARGQATGPEGQAPGPGDAPQGVPHLGGTPTGPGPAPAAPGPAPHAAAPAAPGGDSVAPGAPTPSPVPLPHMSLPPGMHPSGFDGAAGATSGGVSQGGWHAPFTGAAGAGGGVQTAGYTAAAAPRIAQLASAVGVPLSVNPDGSVSSPNAAWQHLLTRESGGRNIRQGIHDANSGGNEAEGYFQITPQTWRSHGGGEFAPNPMAATAEQQAAVAARILQQNPSGSDWGAGVPGRENAADLLAGLGGDPGGSVMPNFPTAASVPAGTMPAGMPALFNPNSVASRVPNAPNVEAGIRAMGGLPTLYPTSGAGAYQVPVWTQQLAKDFGLTASTYASGGSLHQMGYAFDFNGPQPNMDAFADYIQSNLSPQTLQLIHASGQRRWGIASGQDVSAGSYFAGDYGGHFDHVHWATDVPPVMADQPAGVDDSIVGTGSPQFRVAGYQNAGAVASPGGPTPPAMGNIPNINPMGPPHLSGPSMTPGPPQQQPPGFNFGDNSSPQSNFAKQTVQNLTSGMYGIVGSLFGNPDFNPGNWQGRNVRGDGSGILTEPQREHAQHSGGASVTHQSFDHSITFNNTTVANPQALAQQMQESQNSRFYSAAGGLPMSGIGSP